MLCANTRALKFRVLHIAVVEPLETPRSSGRMNLTHLTSTSRQDVLKCAGIVSVFVPRWYSLPCWSTSLSAMASATRLRGQTFFRLTSSCMLVITKSGLTVSVISMFVAPGFKMFSARSSNRPSRSASSGVIATCVSLGSVAHSSSTAGSMPFAPIRPMR